MEQNLTSVALLISNGSSCQLECEDSSSEVTTSPEYIEYSSLQCYWSIYKTMKDPYSYITQEIRKKLKYICLPQCPDLPQSIVGGENYTCDPAPIHQGICVIQGCTSHICSTLGQLQCKKTLWGMKWGTGTIKAGNWTEIKNLSTTIQTACTIPITCTTLVKLHNKSKWENCEPCEANSYRLYEECHGACPLLKMVPNGDIRKVPDVIATCQENGSWTMNNGVWVDPSMYNIANGSYCPGTYCIKFQFDSNYVHYYFRALQESE